MSLLRCARNLLRVSRCTYIGSYTAREFRNTPQWCCSIDKPHTNGPNIAKESSNLKAAEPTTTSNLEAAFKALRDEYDENTLDTMVARKQLTEAQRNLLCKPVPEFMIRSEVFFGNKHRELADLVSRIGFAEDEQYRRIVGIVQPFGAGKTKTALMLSHSFVVLPIRWTTNQALSEKLEKAQRFLFEAINIETVDAMGIQAFSDRCQRLTELTFLSVAAVFSRCASQSWFDPCNADHRLQFALLAVSSDSAVVSEMTQWFEEHIKFTTGTKQFDELRSQELNKVRTSAGLRVVFVVDEIQELRDRCLGYCVHRKSNAGMLEEQFINSWKGELRRRPAEGHGRCTDLFYQLQCVMLKLWGKNAAFIMCSTMFSSWTLMEEQGSPFRRGILHRFADTYWLSGADCKDLIQHYFKVKDEQLDTQVLEVFTRPVFACNLVQQLYSSLSKQDITQVSDIAGWLSASCEATEESSLLMMQGILQKLVKQPAPIGSITSRELVNRLVMSVRLCGGVISGGKVKPKDPVSNERWDSYVELVDRGLLRLIATMSEPNKVEIADPITAEAISSVYKPATELKAVLEILAADIERSGSSASHDKSHKGFVFEKVLAYFAVQGLIKVPKYAADGTITYENLNATAKFAAHFDELRAKTNSPILASEAAFVIDLFGGSLPKELDCVLLPTKLCGPDVLFRFKTSTDDNNDEDEPNDVVVVMQSKLVNKVLEFGRFVKALGSLDPATMFYAAKREESTVWQERRGTLPAEFMRIIFAKSGFTPAVQHTVHEYNLQQTLKSRPSYIHLLNLNDLRKSLGPVYDVLQPVTVQQNLVVSNEMPVYKSTWKENNKKKMMTDKALVKLCRSWGIEHSNKTSKELVEALDRHEKTLAERFEQLAIDQRGGANPA